MDKIELSDSDVVALDHIAPGISGLRILFVNVFGIAGDDGQWTLVDAGLEMSAKRIRNWAEEHFGESIPPASIVLTHGHFDHVGALEELVDKWQVPVYVHSAEWPYVTGREKYPPPDASVGGGLMSVLSRFYPRGPINVSFNARPLPADGSIPGSRDWRWIHTPGHTKGHVSLFRESDRALIVGDAFCTTKQESFLAVATQRPEMHGPPAYYTPDWDAARDSVRRLAGLDPRIIAPSHGQAMAGPEAAQALKVLADDFDRIARPESGRYVEDHTAQELSSNQIEV